MQHSNNPAGGQEVNLGMDELAALLIKSHGITSGLFNLTIELQIGVGAVGPNPDALLPGAQFGISKIGLVRTESPGKNTVDAAKVNPPRKARRKKSVTVTDSDQE